MSERFPDAPIALNRPTVGMVLCMTGLLAFTAHDVVMKLLSDRYSVWELAFVRSLVVLAVIAGVVAIISGPRALRTRRLGLHTLRGVLALSSYTCYYLGIAAMPIVEAAAMFAVGPVLVTALSVPLLGEKVGARRWCAITVAFVGVVVMLRPGTELFRAASLFPMAAATIYAFAVVVTRQLGTTETGSRMAFYTGFVYLAGSVLAGAIIGVWQPSFSSDPSVAFLLRPWQWPQWRDLGLMCLGGVFAAVGFVALSGAYRMAPVAVVAPFEYSQLLWAFGLGYVFFRRPARCDHSRRRRGRDLGWGLHISPRGGGLRPGRRLI